MIVLHGSTDPLKRVRLSPDGRTVAAGGDRIGIRLWNLRTIAQPRVVRGLFQCDFAFTPDGAALLTGFYEAVRATGVASGREELVLPVSAAPTVRPVALDPDGRALV